MIPLEKPFPVSTQDLSVVQHASGEVVSRHVIIRREIESATQQCSYLGRKHLPVYGMFGAPGICTAEMQADLADPEVIRQWSAADVHGPAERIIEKKLDVMSGVFHSSAHLQRHVVTNY